MQIPCEINYENLYLIPQKCVVNSRSECDITVELGGRRFANPVIAANMQSVVNYKTCEYLAARNMFYIMHRFNINKEELLGFVNKMKTDGYYGSISVGTNSEDKELIEYFLSEGCKPEYICIDVAHAHSDRTVDMIKFIKRKMPETFLIVGNVATGDAVKFLDQAGADCVKLFIAPGAACTTKIKTGFTRGTVTCLMECAAITKKPLIADGGIKEPGHIVKAMACGARMVMAGYFMCGFDQNSGQTILIENEKKYIYYGSASFSMKQVNNHIEGTQILVDYKGDLGEHITDIECSLKSAVSYAGKRKLEDICGTPMFIM
jgi:GMP reductase